MSKVWVKRVNGLDKDFKNLVVYLDLELEIIDGDDHDFYHQYNTIHDIEYALVLFLGANPVGCGAIKKYDEEKVEVKRMYVLPDFRGKGFSIKILTELERWGKELGFKKSILETGKRQIAAVNLYVKMGYRKISNYGQYIGVNNSVCFEKSL